MLFGSTLFLQEQKKDIIIIIIIIFRAEIRLGERSDCQNQGGTAGEVFQGLGNFE
jgi:hypothetical protein